MSLERAKERLEVAKNKDLISDLRNDGFVDAANFIAANELTPVRLPTIYGFHAHAPADLEAALSVIEAVEQFRQTDNDPDSIYWATIMYERADVFKALP